MKRIGLVVNPIAGLGGRVGLKGSDGAEIQKRALELGAIPHATERVVEALKYLSAPEAELEILTYPQEMGEYAARNAGFTPLVFGNIQPGSTTAEDTRNAVTEMLKKDLSLLLFAGGDGTARDVYSAGGMEMPSLGIPAGVKIHSAVYGIHPRAAGELAKAYLQDRAGLVLAEVMDLDEEAFRNGIVSPRLFGYLRVPYLERYIQGAKAPSKSSDSLKGIAEELSGWMHPGTIIIFGPGSSTHAIAKFLGMEKNLLGVDAFMDGKILASDVAESTLLDLLTGEAPAKIIVTPIGGQGCIFGRGNQQISPEVIRRVGKNNILIVSTPDKINALKGQPLWVDTGDNEVDKMLNGYLPVFTGYKERIFYKVAG